MPPQLAAVLDCDSHQDRAEAVGVVIRSAERLAYLLRVQVRDGDWEAAEALIRHAAERSIQGISEALFALSGSK
jgi:hypothetical protein